MPEEKVGLIKIARRIYEQCRSVAVDDNKESKRILLNSLIKWKIANYFWMIIAIGIFHLKLLHAIIYPLHSFLTKRFKTIYSNGEMRLPLIFLYKATMVFFALSIIWHCFTWPNSMGILQWNFSVQPQISSTASCSDQMDTTQSQSGTIQCKMNGEVNIVSNARFENIILDSILTIYETIIDFLLLANEFATSIFGFI
ncbi:Pentatricopeptide repeat-containing protein [Dirofilaria immitis]